MRVITNFLCVIAVAAALAANQTYDVARADSPPVVDLSSALDAAALGQLPSGWHALNGDWAARLDEIPAPETSAEALLPQPIVPQREKDCLLHRCLSTDLTGGLIICKARQFGDFTLQYQMKHYVERNYWGNRCIFRVQNDGKRCYSLQIDRPGTLTLSVDDGHSIRTLETSVGRVDVSQGKWNWIRLVAQGNRFRVYACSDGLNYLPFLDVTDDQRTFSDGYIGFDVCNRSRIKFDRNPYQDDANKLQAGAWLDRAEQGLAFRQIAGAPPQYQVLVDAFVANLSKAPTAITLEGEGGKQTVKVADPQAGVNTVSVFVSGDPLKDRATYVVTLWRGSSVLDRGKVTVENRARTKQLSLSNLGPQTPIDDSSPISKDVYMKVLDEAFAVFGNTGRLSWDDRWGQNAVLYRATGDKKYLDRVMEWARIWLHKRATGEADIPNFDFASRPGFALAATVACSDGDFSPAEKKAFLNMISDVLAISPQEGGGVMNRALGYALPIRPLLELVPDHPLQHQALRFDDEVMNDFRTTMEGLENSANYLPITMLNLVAFIDEHGLESLYQDPRLKNAFGNLLELIDSSGALPQFADYGGPQRFNLLLVPTFERLATVYRDGRFKWAAHQIARQALRNLDVTKLIGWDLRALARAYAYADDSIAETSPSNGSMILHRNDGHLDKLVLRSGWGDNDFHVLVDLLSGCEHGDAMALSVVSVDNDGRQSLMDKAGRDITGHSVPLVREHEEDFPYLRKPWESGRWYFASFDLPLHGSFGSFIGGLGSPMAQQYVYGPGTSYLYAGPPIEFSYDPSREFSFALEFNGSGKANVFLKDVKLVKTGPSLDHNESELRLDDFDGPGYRWIGNFQKVRDEQDGKSCGRFEIDFSQSGFIGKKFSMPLDVYNPKYNRIEFWYKIEPVSGDVGGTWVLHLGDKSGTPRNYESNYANNYPVKEKAFKEGPLATFAGFSLEGRGASGDPLRKDREFLFVKNQLLWVRDSMTMEGDRPWVAGPIWQVANLSPSHGDNWYDTWLDTNLMVWFVPKKDAALEMISDPQPKGYDMGWRRSYPVVLSETAHGRNDSTPKVFDTLLIPHKKTENATELAGQIKVLYDVNDVTLLSAGDDLLLMNPAGGQVSTDQLTTDFHMLYVHIKNGEVLGAEGDGGTRATYLGRSLAVR